MVVFKMTLIFADFLAAILEMTSFKKKSLYKIFFFGLKYSHKTLRKQNQSKVEMAIFLGLSLFSHGVYCYANVILQRCHTRTIEIMQIMQNNRDLAYFPDLLEMKY